MAAVILSFVTMYGVCSALHVGPSPAILAAALSLGLMRRPEPLSWPSFGSKLALLPFITLGAALVGFVLLKWTVAGAVLFTGCIALSVWLRNFGQAGRRIGATIALPFLAILIVPVRIDNEGGWPATLLLALLAGVCAYSFTALLSFAIGRDEVTHKPHLPSRTRERSGLSVPARMALQMLTALALAFIFGLLVFHQHWPWVVLTAFIVCSGAIGRGDAIYKGLLRLLGALGGTFLALLVGGVHFPNGIVYAGAIFAFLFVGFVLRDRNYGYWAGSVTVVFALLQGTHTDAPMLLFAIRLAAIVVGALCAIAAVWFVFPIRTEHVVKRRVGDALIAMSAILSGDVPEAEIQSTLDHHTAQLERVAPPVRLHRSLFTRKDQNVHPATWIDDTHTLLVTVRTPAFDRRHVATELRRIRDALRGSTPGSDARAND